MSTPLPKQESRNVLHRSQMEIVRILQGLRSGEVAVYSDIGSADEEQLFISHILAIDVESEAMILSYSPDKSINNAVMRYPALKLRSNHQGARLAFMAYKPKHVIFKDQPAIQMQFPHSLLVYHREYARVRIPREAALKCRIRIGDGDLVEMSVADISLDGMGCLQYTGRDHVAVGTVLQDCRIFLTKGNSISADLMVRYTKPVFMKDGSVATRIGVRFVQRPEEIEALINHFTRILDDSEI